MKMVVPILAMMLAYSTTARAHIPARCDPIIDRYVDAQDHLTWTLQAYGVWLEHWKDRLNTPPRGEVASLVAMVRDRDIASSDVAQALIALFLCMMD